MAGRIVIFGATGYTGRLTAEALVEHDQRPVLAGRDGARLEALAAELGGLETAVADVTRPESVAALVEEGDALIATVGPFAKWGDAAAEAAIAKRAHYLDSTGEPPFIRRVFEHYGPLAEAAGIGMVTAFGYDWVPGNLAAALALRDAGEEAVRVDTGYFVTGAGAGPSSFSGGTKASVAGIAMEPVFAFRGGELRTVRNADRYRRFAMRGRELPAIAVGSSEHFGLPPTYPRLTEVNSYLGWFGPLSRPMQAFSLVGGAAVKIPGARSLTTKLAERFVHGSTGGPGREQRARSGSYIVAEAYDAGGAKLAEVHLTGVDPYTFTAGILAWGARRAATDGMLESGALGPVGAFGLDELEAGCREAGLTRA